jgi:hypothetical protein
MKMCTSIFHRRRVSTWRSNKRPITVQSFDQIISLLQRRILPQVEQENMVIFLHNEAPLVVTKSSITWTKLRTTGGVAFDLQVDPTYQPDFYV